MEYFSLKAELEPIFNVFNFCKPQKYKEVCKFYTANITYKRRSECSCFGELIYLVPLNKCEKRTHK